MNIRDDSDDDFIFIGLDLESEEWVPAGQALSETIDFYASVREGDRFEAERDAISAFLHRLAHGEMLARSHRWYHGLKHSVVSDDAELLQALAPTEKSDRETEFIETGFWWNLSEIERERKEVEADTGAPFMVDSVKCNWIAGDFDFFSHMIVEGDAIKSIEVHGFAFGVHFNRKGLPTFSRFSPGAPRVGSPRKRVRDDRPRLPDSALMQWWAALPDATKSRSQDDLLMTCQTAFPRNSIARDRIRELTGPRKRGPKPIGGKETA